MSSNEADSRAVAWQAFVRMQAILTYPRHPHWQEYTWAEHAHHLSKGFRDLFTLSELEREQAENLFFATIIRMQAVEGVQQPLAQQWKAGPAIHGALEQLEFGDMSLRWSIAFGPRQPGDHSALVLLQAIGKTLEFLDVTSFGLLQPGAEAVAPALVEDLPKRLNQGVEGINR